jgi:hypothetical protein
MSQHNNNENISLHRTFQWIVIVFSLIFFIVLSNGYFNLLISINKAFAIFSGVILAFLAWSLAKFIGSSPGRIKGNFPLFILLLLLSAVGVFNSLMTNLEGKKIFQEAIDDAAIRFRNLPIITKKALRNPIIEEKRAKVENLKGLFFEELHNPQNCGQGPVASQLAQKIKDELPAFQVLSGPGSCSKVDKIIASYDLSIERLLLNSKEFADANYKEIQTAQDDITQKEQTAQNELNKIKSEINDGGNLLIDARLGLEKISTLYQNMALELTKLDPNNDFPKFLEMNSVRNLGEWSQIINLIISRLDQLSTYVYLFLALFFDWILIYLFSRLKNLTQTLQSKNVTLRSTKISSPW